MTDPSDSTSAEFDAALEPADPVASDRKAPPALAGLLTATTAPLLTADEQPPAPGSNWAVRGWHRMRLLGGHAVEALPKNPSTPMMVLRLLVVALVWAAMAVVAMYAAVIWLCFILPIQLLIRIGSSKGSPSPALSAPPQIGLPPPGAGPPPLGAAPPLLMDPQSLAAVLATAPSPRSVVAAAHCLTCGGETAGAVEWCTYCGSPLPMVEKRGWHPDPVGLAPLRWFDGERWTEHARAVP